MTNLVKFSDFSERMNDRLVQSQLSDNAKAAVRDVVKEIGTGFGGIVWTDKVTLGEVARASQVQLAQDDGRYFMEVEDEEDHCASVELAHLDTFAKALEQVMEPFVKPSKFGI